jgi:hypothetical protein
MVGAARSPDEASLSTGLVLARTREKYEGALAVIGLPSATARSRSLGTVDRNGRVSLVPKLNHLSGSHLPLGFLLKRSSHLLDLFGDLLVDQVLNGGSESLVESLSGHLV